MLRELDPDNNSNVNLEQFLQIARLSQGMIHMQSSGHNCYDRTNDCSHALRSTITGPWRHAEGRGRRWLGDSLRRVVVAGG
jgi:hypothetical protein